MYEAMGTRRPDIQGSPGHSNVNRDRYAVPAGSKPLTSQKEESRRTRKSNHLQTQT